MTAIKAIILILVIVAVLTVLITAALYMFLFRIVEKRRRQHKLNIKKAIMT